MQNTLLPQANEWNQFWDGAGKLKKSHPSWSKRRILRLLQPFMLKGHYVLDAGCGSGFFSNAFAQKKMNVYSLDYSDEALQLTQHLTDEKTTLLKKDLVKDRLSEDLSCHFNLVFTDGLFEHFSTKHQDEIMKNLCSVLHDDGLIITFVPNQWSPWELIRPLFMPGIQEIPFKLKELVALNERNGLRIIHKGGINVVPFVFSPDSLLGSYFGMLLFTIARKKK